MLMSARCPAPLNSIYGFSHSILVLLKGGTITPILKMKKPRLRNVSKVRQPCNGVAETEGRSEPHMCLQTNLAP